MKKILLKVFVCTLCLIQSLTIFPNLVFASEFIGCGTKQDPYIISNEDEYNLFAQYVNNGETFEGKYFLQTSDILFTSPKYGETRIYGIGKDKEFAGVYDGGGYTITLASSYNEIAGYILKNLGVKKLDYGLFGLLSGTVVNLNVSGYFRFANDCGIFAGKIIKNGKLINCCANEVYSLPRLDGKTFYGLASTKDYSGKAIYNCAYIGALIAADVGASYPITDNADAEDECRYLLTSTANADKIITEDIGILVTQGQISSLYETMNLNLGIAAENADIGIDRINKWVYSGDVLSVGKTRCIGNVDIDSYTTKSVTPWMKKYNMTSYTQILNDYHGGEGWQKIKCMSVSPFSSDIAIFGTDTSGIWTTFDGAESWQNTSYGFNSFGVLDVDYDPKKENLVYAIGYPGYSYSTNLACGVYVSENNGLTWQCVLENIKVEEAQSKNNILAFKKLDSMQASRVYVALYTGGIIYSDDIGKTWNTLGLENYKILGFEFVGNAMYVLTLNNGIYKSIDGGESFEKLTLSVKSNDTEETVEISDSDVLSIALNPNDAGNIVFVTQDYCVSSDDYGISWKILDKLSTRWGRKLTRVEFGPPDSDGKCALYVNGAIEKLRHSVDGGETVVSANADTLLHFNGEEGWYQGVWAASAQDPNIVYAASIFEIAKSTDRGANFLASSSGYSGMRAVDFAFNPENDYEYYFSFVDTGIVKSCYSGMGEQYPAMRYAACDSNGIRYNGYKTVQAIALDPKDNNRLLLATGVGKDTIIKETKNGGYSYNVFEGTVGECYKIAFHSQNPNIIYAGKYISSDNGISWKDCGYEIRAVSPVDSNVIWGVLNGTLYKSSDGGSTWSDRITGVGGGNIEIIADIQDKDKLYICDYVSGYRVLTLDGITSNNCGFVCWTIAQDPKNPSHLVAGGCDSNNKKPAQGIYESYDGGENWQYVPGLTGSCDVWGMAFHPKFPKVYIGTSSGTFAYEYEKFESDKIHLVYEEGLGVVVQNPMYSTQVCDIIVAEYEGEKLKSVSIEQKNLLPYEKVTFDAASGTKVFAWDTSNIIPLGNFVTVP